MPSGFITMAYQSGSRYHSRLTGDGFWIVTTAPGIPRCDCFGRRSQEIGSLYLAKCGGRCTIYYLNSEWSRRKRAGACGFALNEGSCPGGGSGGWGCLLSLFPLELRGLATLVVSLAGKLIHHREGKGHGNSTQWERTGNGWLITYVGSRDALACRLRQGSGAGDG
jgi:hypothetical protein